MKIGTVPSQGKRTRTQSDKIPKSYPETMFPLKNSDTKEDTLQLTHTLIGVLPISPPGEKEQMKEQCNSDDCEFFN